MSRAIFDRDKDTLWYRMYRPKPGLWLSDVDVDEIQGELGHVVVKCGATYSRSVACCAAGKAEQG